MTRRSTSAINISDFDQFSTTNNSNYSETIIMQHGWTSTKEAWGVYSKHFIKNGSYNGSAFYRVVDNTLVQAGDLEYGNIDKINYYKVGSGQSKLGNLKSELNEDYPFALIKYLDKNFDKNQTFKCKNGSLKIFIPKWLEIWFEIVKCIK